MTRFNVVCAWLGVVIGIVVFAWIANWDSIQSALDRNPLYFLAGLALGGFFYFVTFAIFAVTLGEIIAQKIAALRASRASRVRGPASPAPRLQ